MIPEPKENRGIDFDSARELKFARKRLAQLGQHECICMFDRLAEGREVIIYESSGKESTCIGDPVPDCVTCGNTGWCY